MRIFLIGMMGAGKSFYGKKIASSHHKLFLDTDVLIQDFLKKDIATIFEQDGEIFFRKIENEILKSSVEKYDDFIMACGGGLPCYDNTMTFLQQKGISVYIKQDEETLYQNIKNEIAKRPLLHHKNEAQIKSYIATLLKERNKIYNKSDVIIDMSNIDERNFVENFYNIICTKKH